MELHEIRYFLTLSQTLNFTRAAEICHVSQPALTRSIRKLEEELGGLLFSRNRNDIKLTELGRLIKPHLNEVIAREGQVKQVASKFVTLEKANLTIGVMSTIAPLQFVRFLEHFRADNPGIEITLLKSIPGRLGDLLVSGQLDVALMGRPDGFMSPLRAIPLYRERFVVACSANHRLAVRSHVTASELEGEYYFSCMNCEFRDVLHEICESQGVKLLKSYRSEREDWILTMVAAGLGVCFLPEYTASFPGVAGCPIVEPTITREVCLVTVSGRRASSPLAAFVHAVRRYTWPAGNCDEPTPLLAPRKLSTV